MRVSIIAAIDERRGLGKNNDLLFKISTDMKRFRALTSSHPVIMGRKTFESLNMPHGLPNRINVIITRDDNYKVEGAVVVHSLEEAIGVAEEKERTSLRGEERRSNPIEEIATPDSIGIAMTDKEVFIIGGGQIFKEALEKNLVDRLYLTLVKGDYGADVFFPDYSQFTKVLKKEEHEEEGYQFSFLDLEK
jgi:dihydrofolate reductase